MSSKQERTEQAMKEFRIEALLRTVRGWRDEPNTDRAFLMGHHDRLCGEPHFCLLVERPRHGEPNSTKVRGSCEESALRAALGIIEERNAAS